MIQNSWIKIEDSYYNLQTASKVEATENRRDKNYMDVVITLDGKKNKHTISKTSYEKIMNTIPLLNITVEHK